jgi:aspartate-semialdehyde dehydrogenase
MGLLASVGEPYHEPTMLAESRNTATTSKRSRARGNGSGGRLPVAVAGATGTVGQRFIQLLEAHPWFHVDEVMASDQSAGKSYAEAVTGRWKLSTPIPPDVARRVLKGPGEKLRSKVLFSSLDASVAGELEERYARAGHLVSSNSRNHRLDPLVPLVVPEVNRDHIELLDRQGRNGGGILTNPNCSTIVLVMALAPLHRAFGVESVIVTTFQATSGAGYPGVPSLDILGNVIPFISGEEPKMESETNKILGRLNARGIEHAEISISAQCHRVPVIDGHLEAVSVKLRRKASLKQLVEAFEEFRPLAKLGLPLAPSEPIQVRLEEDRPQPRLDVDREGGMGVTIGRIRPCAVLDWKFDALGHNTIRGAAGAAILNAELLRNAGRL